MEIPFVTRSALFTARHPELAAYLPELLSTYRTHEWTHLGGGIVDLDEAFRHIFEERCDWCLENFQSARRLKDEFSTAGK